MDFQWTSSGVQWSSLEFTGIHGVGESIAKLRTAQCQDALEGVRNTLKLKTWMIAFKNQNIRGQRQGTCSYAVINRMHDRVRNSVEKYRVS